MNKATTTRRQAIGRSRLVTAKDAGLLAQAAPKSWLLAGTAIKIGLFSTLGGMVVSIPAPALAACQPAPATVIACGNGPGGYEDTTKVTSETWVHVVSGGVVTTGININNATNTASFHVQLDGPSDPLLGADVKGGTKDGINIVTTTGSIDVNSDEGTSVAGATGNKDGIRLRTTTGGITVDLNGDVKAGTTGGEAVDAQSSSAGTVDVSLHHGTYTGIASQTIVAGSVGGEADVHVDNGVTIAGATAGTGNHGIWVIQSNKTNVDLDGTLTATNGNGIEVGYNGTVGTATDANINVSGSVTGLTGVSVNTNGADGDVFLGNSGHIEGTTGAGAVVLTKGDITGYNNGYDSWIGATDGYEASGNSFDFSNGAGLVGGLGDDGFYVHNIAGVGFETANSVSIGNNGFWDNHGTPGYTPDDVQQPGGIIYGADEAVNVDTVALGSVAIYNGGYTGDDKTQDNYGRYSPGGLIIGGNNGVAVRHVDAGGVQIDNTNTWSDSVDLTNIDVKVKTPLGALGAGFPGSTTTAGHAGGIWGVTGDGVHLWDISNNVSIGNSNGLIVGGGGDGVFAGNVDGHGSTDVSNPYVAFNLENGGSYENPNNGGLVWGKDNGVHTYDMDGDVNINNGNGTIYGNQEGIRLIDTWRGNVNINNDGGTIQGLYDDGIHIDGVKHSTTFAWGGGVQINNNGTVFGGDSAISIANAQTASINNGHEDSGYYYSGSIIGDGGSGQAVINLNNVDGDSTTPTDVAAHVYNSYGSVIGSFALPEVTTSWSSPGVAATPNWLLDGSTLMADAAGFQDFVWNGGSQDTTRLALYADASNDRAIRSNNGGSTGVDNDGLMVGRINLDGKNGTVGNSVNNNGVWMVSGSNSLHGTLNDDSFNNSGVIQTAFADGHDWAGFTADSFNNKNNGVISMLDGDTHDVVTIRGNYNGNGGSIAEDLDLANLDADQLHLRGGDDITGQTGIIFRLVDTGGGALHDRIEVVNYNGGSDPVAADAFIVSSLSDHYIDVGGTGMIEDGLLAWYMQQDHHDGFDLVAGWGPGAYNAPGVITVAQNAFDSGMGVVEDHVYGGQFGSPGGSGADLPVKTEASISPKDIGATNVAVWAKFSGDHSDTDTSVTATTPGVTFDTSVSANTYSVIGGADIIPSGTNFRVGVFGGYTNAQADFGGPGTSASLSGGTVGLYGAYNNGSLYADVTGKADLLAVTYNYAGTSADATATNIGVSANVGYRVNMGQMFVEPIGSAQVVNTQVGSMSGIDFQNATSVRLGVGGRIGTRIATGDLTTELSLLGKVWDELGDPNTAVIDDGAGHTLTATSDVGGISGELSAAATVWSSDKGLSGFVSADSKFGDSSMSYGGKVGVRAGF